MKTQKLMQEVATRLIDVTSCYDWQVQFQIHNDLSGRLMVISTKETVPQIEMFSWRDWNDMRDQMEAFLQWREVDILLTYNDQL